MKLAVLLLGACALVGCATSPAPQPTPVDPPALLPAQTAPAALVDRQFEPLPLGSIRPAGWLHGQLRLQADGLSGHLDEFWPDIRDSGWIGGPAEGWERAPYWLDGLVPLAWLLDDAALKQKVTRWMDYILEHQREDGWLGPAGSKGYKDYDPWPRFVLLKALAQYHEATGDERVIAAMGRFFRFLDTLLDKQPLFDWGQFRWMDGVWSVHWLYDRTGESWLLGLAAKLHAQGYDWNAHFDDFQYPERVAKGTSLKTHGVNNAMAVKAGAVWFRQSGAKADYAAARRAIETLDRYHGQVTGMFTCDEHYAGLSPSQGTELCTVVEYMFSLETAIAVLGDALLADRLERITFNALPATFKKDMWAHQYDQQVNQVLCRVAQDRPWATNGPEANIFGLEPNYGCCTANMHQGWPKFTSSLWMKTADGIGAISYAPCDVDTEIGGKRVVLNVRGDYPFGDRVEITVAGEGSFSLMLRIPAWAGRPTVAVNGEPAQDVQPGAFHVLRREWRGTSKVVLDLPSAPMLERRFNNSGAVVCGPLVYALPLGEYWKKIRGDEPHADWEVYPTTPWNYALVPSAAWAPKTNGVRPHPFSPEGAPVSIEVEGRLLPEWVLEHNAAGPLPQSPVAGTQPFTRLTLIPYGCTNLRVTEFPVIDEQGAKP